jgi:hypothetical protein
VGFQPTIAASERAKAVHALDPSATVTGTPTTLHDFKYLHGAVRTSRTGASDEVEITLRLTASQSVRLGVEPPSGAHDEMLFTV